MARPLSRCLALALGLAPFAAAQPSDAPAPATAPKGREGCFDAHEQSQELRLDDKFVEARKALLLCSDERCPKAIKGDCIRWLEEIESLTPTLLISALSEKGDESDVEVFVDEQRVWERLRGRALELNPGPHQLRFRMVGRPEVKQFVLVREGEKGRMVTADFTPKSQPAVAKPQGPAPAMFRPIPRAVYWLGGLALAGAAGSAYFGIQAIGDRNSARDECSPVCGKSRMSELRADALTADVLGGLALGSAALATWLYLSRPSVPVPQAAVTTPLQLGVSRQGAWLSYGGSL